MTTESNNVNTLYGIVVLITVMWHLEQILSAKNSSERKLTQWRHEYAH